MKNLFATTALALLVAMPAMAANEATKPTIGQRVDEGVADTKQAAADAVERVRDMMAEKDHTGAYGTVAVNPKATAAGIIGQSVLNVRNESVAKVEDILLDQSGNASQIILSNGGLMGIGAKLVAVDFGLVYVRNNNDDVIVPITEETIKKMTPFSYDAADTKDGARTIPAGMLSAKALLDGHMVDSKGNKVAAIDNITLTGGHADQVIVAYDTTLGVGGEKLAVPYSQLQKIATADHDEVNLKLTDVQTARFESYKAAN